MNETAEECSARRAAAYRAATPEQATARAEKRAAAYVAMTPEQRAQRRAREKARMAKPENREKARAWHKANYLANPEKLKATAERWRQRNLAHSQQRSRERAAEMRKDPRFPEFCRRVGIKP